MSKYSDVYEKLYSIVYQKTFCNTIDTERAMSALNWYASSGRIPLLFEQRLCNRTENQLDRIADRMVKNSGCSYEQTIKSIKQCLCIRKFV